MKPFASPLALLSLTLLLLPDLGAQDKKPTPGKGPDPRVQKKKAAEARKRAAEEARKQAEIEKRIREQRARIAREGVKESHIQVKITLRNGETMRGVVKNGRFVEKPTRLEFVRADMKVKGAGIRLWYYDNTSGFIFLAYRQIKTYKILRKMTEVEVADLHNKMLAQKLAARRKSGDAKKKIDDKKDAFDQKKVDAEQAKKKVDELAKKQAAEREEAKLKSLLTEFPPEDGWGQEKATEIRARFINVGVPPDPKSQRFLDNLDDWTLAYERYGKKDKK